MLWAASKGLVADQLYLSLWFPTFMQEEMLPRFLAVIRQFPFSEGLPRFKRLAAHALDWTETLVLEQHFDATSAPEEAVALASEILHDDYAYQFDAFWDLWLPKEDAPDEWRLQPAPVQIVIHGIIFDGGIFRDSGHILFDLGLTPPFSFEGSGVTEEARAKVKLNVEKLIAFANAVEKRCGISGRLLWTESQTNLAQQLVDRLQQVQ